MMEYKATDLTPDLRRMRASQMTAHVMHTIAKYITNEEDDFLRQAHDDLFELFYNNGVDIITDQHRADAGLSPRGQKGWTIEELQALELRRLEMLTKPIQMLVPSL